jgi:AraC-like DNA-binding protein
MLVQHLYQPYDIHYLECDVCPVPEHRLTFFEFIYIVKGTGIQHVNGNTLPYYPDNLFLLMPDDVHHFEVGATTTFLFIRFNDVYLESQKAMNVYDLPGDWVRKMEYIFQHASHMPGCIMREPSDKPLVKTLIDAIIREYVNQKVFHREIVQQLVNTIIAIVTRNITVALPASSITQSTPSRDMINYIQQNIYTPEKLKAGNIATQFNISANYISEYFKSQTGETLQQFIINYKLKLVETRLQYSEMRMSEIVAELGFTDESHLNRSFKKHKGISPSAFRKKTLRRT